jgi:hypothetical protein
MSAVYVTASGVHPADQVVEEPERAVDLLRLPAGVDGGVVGR